MNDARIFRKINNIETNIIIKSLYNVSVKLPSEMDSFKEFLYVSIEKSTIEKAFPKIYLITYEQMKLINEINFKGMIYAAGLYFGFIKKGNFYLSIEGAEYLYKQRYFSEFQRIEVNEVGEKSILYGNNILKKIVVHSPIDLKKRDFLLLLNENDELLGLGFSQINNEQILDLNPSGLIALNLSDKGYYLRQQ